MGTGPASTVPLTASSAGCLAVDVGKSQVRFTLRTESGIVTHVTEPGYNHAAHDDGVDGVLSVLNRAVSRLPHPPRRCVLASTGLSADLGDRRRLANGVAAAVGTSEVGICDDFVAAHAGALSGPGTVVIAGTGAIAFSLSGDGAWSRVDGWGPYLGDDGGAFSVGRSGLRAALAAADGRGLATALMERAERHMGGLDIQAAYRLHTSPDAVAVIAAFAPQVAAAAAGGDVIARAVMAETVDALCRAAITGAARSGSPLVSWSGRLFDLGEQLLSPLAKLLASKGVRLVPPHGAPLDGALALCGRDDSLYAGMITVTDNWGPAS